MPDTPIYGITYPCASATVSANDFRVLAEDVEAALVATELKAVATAHLANARGLGTVNPAFGVEGTFIYTAIPAQNYSNGIIMNTATGVFTVVTAGVYSASARLQLADSTLTMTSQRIAVAVNGTNIVSKKYRGFNPPDPTVLLGTYDCDVFFAVGDLVTFRFLWTGTGALLSGAQASISLDLLATP